MLKALIFDMDGTVLDTIDDIADSVNHAFKTFGFPLKTVEEVKQNVGKGARYLVEQVMPQGLSNEVKEDVFASYQDYYDQHSMDKTGPYEGIIETLKTLKNQGFKLAVVSNKFEYLVKKLNQDVFENLFDVAIGEVKGIPIKPAPDMVYKAIYLLDIDIHEAIYIGDSETDMLTARNAQLPVIAVTWGFRDAHVLKAFDPDHIIDHPKTLIDIIERINL